jgi:SHS family lactate transporter-like MFS transporter
MSPKTTNHPGLFSQVNKDQWRAFFATFFGWVLDGFDFTILTFILIDIQDSFTIDKALAGALGTVTLVFRLAGGMAAGVAADRWGRKLPLMISIVWFSIFACLSGFSTSYGMLFALRALFGIGMGGEWAAGMPLALEHWPARLRGLASGMLQSGWYWGYILSAGVYHFIYPMFSNMPDMGWRIMFWIGIIPAFFALWIRMGVKESPVWLARKQRIDQNRDQHVSVWRIFHRDLLGTTIQASLLIGAFMFSYYSIAFWYPTFLIETGRSPLPHIITLNIGGIIGMILWGRLSETRLGRRGVISIAAGLGVLVIPLYLWTEEPLLFLFGALLMGINGTGIWSMAPAYLTERFPTSVRGVGPGFAYHMGAFIGAWTPTILGNLQDSGMTIVESMTTCIIISGVMVVVIAILGPETRGKEFIDLDEITNEPGFQTARPESIQ